MEMDDQLIIIRLKEKFGQRIIDVDLSNDMPVITIPADSIFNVVSFLKNDSNLQFEFLTDICGIHYPDKDLPLGVVYHLHNLRENKRIRLKIFVSNEKPEVPTLTHIFSSANWMERETYDFYGIRFIGHPNLIRILNVEYLDFFPMRKEYPVEDPTREDKDNRFFGR
ncbi:MAG: NADH-quinone oxidoreductase subunit C [Bacteroidota bacterium]